MNKKQIKRVLRTVFIIASISSLYFVPWILVKAWILPLPDTVQEQLEEGIGLGFDGMIVMSGYYVGYDADLKYNDFINPAGSMVATAEDVGIFLRALNDGSVFNEGEQEIYSSIYVYEHTGLLPGYQSIAKYHKDIDTVVIQFNNTTNFDGYDWNLAVIIYNRIVKILRRKQSL